MQNTFFLHGLDSSSHGTKGRYFQKHFPEVICPDFSGDLRERLLRLERLVGGRGNLVLIGSSFGGLLATSFAIRHPDQVKQLILLAPALGFCDFRPPATALACPTLLVMGRDDTVCPPLLIEPLARATFSNLTVRLADDDHLLRTIFSRIEWPELLQA